MGKRLKISYDKEVVVSILGKTAELLNEVGLTNDVNDKNIRKMILKITKDIDSMFLAKDLIERMLIYARQHAKALQK
jgi:chorismate mutase